MALKMYFDWIVFTSCWQELTLLSFGSCIMKPSGHTLFTCSLKFWKLLSMFYWTSCLHNFHLSAPFNNCLHFCCISIIAHWGRSSGPQQISISAVTFHSSTPVCYQRLWCTGVKKHWFHIPSYLYRCLLVTSGILLATDLAFDLSFVLTNHWNSRSAE